MKWQILFSRKNKKNCISLSSSEFAHSMVSVKKPSAERASTVTPHNYDGYVSPRF